VKQVHLVDEREAKDLISESGGFEIYPPLNYNSLSL